MKYQAILKKEKIKICFEFDNIYYVIEDIMKLLNEDYDIIIKEL